VPSVSQAQDQFKLRTLEAMARGSGPYGEASDRVASAEDEALRGQAGDTGGTGAPADVAGDIASGVTTGSDAVQNYLGDMESAQSAYNQAFQEAQAGYAPPPIYRDAGAGGSISIEGLGLTADDLGIKPQVFPEEYGGGLRHGGFRTATEGAAAVRGLAEREALRKEGAKAMLDAAALQAGDRSSQSGWGFLDANVAARAAAGARQEQAEALNQRDRLRTPGSSRLAAGGTRAAIRDAVDRAQAAKAVQYLPSEQKLIDESLYTSRADAKKSRVATEDAEAFVVPEDWELQQQAAMDWGYNPYIAEGLFDEPTDQERNSMIREQIELAQRLADPEGYSMQERTGADRMQLDLIYGADVVDQADSLGIDPSEFLSISSDPMFQAAEADAAEIYADTGGDLDTLEASLIDSGLDPVQIRMILAAYSGLGVNSANVDRDYVGG
jgi:hypothetical protein